MLEKGRKVQEKRQLCERERERGRGSPRKYSPWSSGMQEKQSRPSVWGAGPLEFHMEARKGGTDCSVFLHPKLSLEEEDSIIEPVQKSTTL